MKGPISVLAIFCVAFAASKNLANRYDDFKVFRVTIADDAAANVINSLEDDYVDVWADPRVGRHADIMVSPTDVSFVEKKLKVNNMGKDDAIKSLKEFQNLKKQYDSALKEEKKNAVQKSEENSNFCEAVC